MSSAPTVSHVQGSASDRPQGLQPGERLFQMALGFMGTAALGCVAELDIAEHLKNGPRTVAELAAETGVKEEPLYRVLRALASAEIFAENEPRTFRLTPAAELLCCGAKGSMRDMVRWMGSRIHFETYPEMMHSL